MVGTGGVCPLRAGLSGVQNLHSGSDGAGGKREGLFRHQAKPLPEVSRRKTGGFSMGPDCRPGSLHALGTPDAMHRLTLEAVPVTLLLPEVLDVEEQGRCGLLSCWAPYSGTLDAPCLAALPSLLDK